MTREEHWPEACPGPYSEVRDLSTRHGAPTSGQFHCDIIYDNVQTGETLKEFGPTSSAVRCAKKCYGIGQFFVRARDGQSCNCFTKTTSQPRPDLNFDMGLACPPRMSAPPCRVSYGWTNNAFADVHKGNIPSVEECAKRCFGVLPYSVWRATAPHYCQCKKSKILAHSAPHDPWIAADACDPEGGSIAAAWKICRSQPDMKCVQFDGLGAAQSSSGVYATLPYYLMRGPAAIRADGRRVLVLNQQPASYVGFDHVTYRETFNTTTGRGTENWYYPWSAGALATPSKAGYSVFELQKNPIIPKDAPASAFAASKWVGWSILVTSESGLCLSADQLPAQSYRLPYLGQEAGCPVFGSAGQLGLQLRCAPVYGVGSDKGTLFGKCFEPKDTAGFRGWVLDPEVLANKHPPAKEFYFSKRVCETACPTKLSAPGGAPPSTINQWMYLYKLDYNVWNTLSGFTLKGRITSVGEIRHRMKECGSSCANLHSRNTYYWLHG